VSPRAQGKLAAMASIARASAMSFSVTPPASWVESAISTRFHTFDQSG